MASGANDIMSTTAIGTVEITELVAVCGRLEATNVALFERLGAWVADESDPARQRWFAVAGHRHAWHAELWAERRPRIPHDAPIGVGETSYDSDDRAEWYARQVTRLQEELAQLEARIDPVLDPSTARVITLVGADLAALRSPVQPH